MAERDRMAPIVHVVQHLRPGGLEVMALELARAQDAVRPSYVLSLDGDAPQALAAWRRLQAQRGQLIFMNKRAGRDAGLVLRLAALFRRIRPACVHTHHIGPLLYAGPAARLAGVGLRLHTEHDAWHLDDPRRARLARLALRLAAPKLIADAPHVADAAARALRIPRPLVVLNGIDTSRFAPASMADCRAALGLADRGRVIGIAARLEHVKGVDLAISAMAQLPDDVSLVIAGQGSEGEALMQQVQAAGLAGRVRFLGHVDDMAGFYNAIDVLCLPSRHEGLPLSLLEAQSCGTPVVACDVGGVAAAVAPDAGRLVAAGDVAGLAAALRAVLAQNSANPREFVVRHASLATSAAAYLALIGAPAPAACGGQVQLAPAMPGLHPAAR